MVETILHNTIHIAQIPWAQVHPGVRAEQSREFAGVNAEDAESLHHLWVFLRFQTICTPLQNPQLCLKFNIENKDFLELLS